MIDERREMKDERRQMRRVSVRGGARTPMTEPSIWYMSRRRIYKDERLLFFFVTLGRRDGW